MPHIFKALERLAISSKVSIGVAAHPGQPIGTCSDEMMENAIFLKPDAKVGVQIRDRGAGE